MGKKPELAAPFARQGVVAAGELRIDHSHHMSKLGVCVCAFVTLCLEEFLGLCRGPAHGITTLANEASDVMQSSQRRPTVYLLNFCTSCDSTFHYSWFFTILPPSLSPSAAFSCRAFADT